MATKKADKKPASGPVAQNRKARHEYFIEDEIEAGIVLLGTEVKSLRAGRATIGDAYAGEKGGEIWMYNANIPPYTHAANRANHEPNRARKLLLHERQIKKLAGYVKQKGVTLIPLKIYFNKKGIAKVLVGLARGKTQYDKRDTIKKRDWEREKSQMMKKKNQ